MGAIDTSTFYMRSCEAGFVKLEAVGRNIAWSTPTEWGDIELTINLSKPEKDPRAIAAAAGSEAGPAAARSYIDPATGRARACPLCVEQADLDCGYARELTVDGQMWGLWYSPYAYYDEHCIAMSWQHRPMHIDRSTFRSLFDLVEMFPHYFFGSNADLPIVGGSILGHDHFQGGRHLFPMQKAPLSEAFELPGFPDVAAGIVSWPVSVVRLLGSRRDDLTEAACRVLDAWCSHDDAEAGIVSGASAMPGASFSDGRPKGHNTITPILRKSGDSYQLDLALRCNITTDEHPLGLFHPHAELHHIKKENIGLIEVMGLAILPPRVQQTMADRGLSRDDVGELFARVLSDAGVFKWDASGRAAAHRFLDVLCS